MIKLNLTDSLIGYSPMPSDRSNVTRNPTPDTKDRDAKMIMKRNRRMTDMIKKLYSLGTRPMFFISLVYPTRIAKEMNADRVKQDLNILASRIRYRLSKRMVLLLYRMEPGIKTTYSFAG